MADPRPLGPPRPRWFWVSVVGVLLGLVVIALRVLTLEANAVQPFAIAVLGALIVTVVLGALAALRIGARMRAAAAAFPTAVLIPIVLGPATSVASRWLADRSAEPALRVRDSGTAVLAVDAAGIHLLADVRGPVGHVPATAVRLGGLGRTRIGMRESDALLLEVTIDGQSAPLPLVPRRLHGNPLGRLTDAELLEVAARVEGALRGRAVPPGWAY